MATHIYLFLVHLGLGNFIEYIRYFKSSYVYLNLAYNMINCESNVQKKIEKTKQ